MKIKCEQCLTVFNNNSGKCPSCGFLHKYMHLSSNQKIIQKWIDSVSDTYDYKFKSFTTDPLMIGYERHKTLSPETYNRSIKRINESFQLLQVFENKKYVRWQITSMDENTLELSEVRIFSSKKDKIKINKNVRRILKRTVFAKLIKNGFYQDAVFLDKADSSFLASNGFYELLK